MASSRINLLWGVLGVVGGLALGAWYAGSQIQSPAELAARTAAPQPSPILVPVEQRVLSTDVVTRGTVRFGLPQPVSIVPSTLKGAAGLLATLPVPNTPFKEGDVLLSASGRPVFVLQGDTPTYRDMSPGRRGEDVRQLEAALARLGMDPGEVDGVYDQRTAEAVERWYRQNGWEPFGPTREQLATVAALERDLSDATRSRLAAEGSHQTALGAMAAAQAVADQGMRQAALDAAGRVDDRRRPEQASTGQPLLIETERARAAHALSTADAEIAAQINEHATITLDPRQTEAARLQAEARLEAARAARRKAKLEADLAMETAERENRVALARASVAAAALRAARLEGERGKRAAQEQLMLAQFDLRAANERVARLEKELSTARGTLGVQVPADEVVFLPALPVRVHEVTAAVGASAAGSVMTVTDNQLSIDAQLPIDAGPLVKPGMPVTVDEQALGIKATGVVDFVASTPGTRGVDGYHFYLGVKLSSTPIRLAGFSVRLTIPVETTSGAVTAVPVSALSLAADGTSRVQVDNGGALEYVTVQPGLAAGGYVEVSAADGRLLPGRMVVVGYKMAEPGA